jgi:hypothetical protein
MAEQVLHWYGVVPLSRDMLALLQTCWVTHEFVESWKKVLFIAEQNLHCWGLLASRTLKSEKQPF